MNKSLFRLFIKRFWCPFTRSSTEDEPQCQSGTTTCWVLTLPCSL